MAEVASSQPKQGAVIGGWVCLAIGTGLMVWSLLSFILYLPLFLAAFVLGIVAIAQRHLGNGIPILLLSVVVPLVLGLSLSAYRSARIFQNAQQQSSSHSSPSTSMPSTAAVPKAVEAPKGPSAEQLYIQDNLEIYEFEAKYMDAVLEGRIPGVRFKLRNKGDKTLDRVKVVVLFKDASGAVIAEQNYLPVLVSECNFSGGNKPLKPGYIWQMEQGKFYKATSVPNEWKEGSAEARITEVRFAKAVTE
jgi:hypothetical protein